MKLQTWLQNRGINVGNVKFLLQAFVHSSYLNEHKQAKHDNERLEFMGDAVLQLWVSEKLMKLKNPLSEGKMTILRAQLVCEEALASYCRQLELNQFIMLGVGEERNGGRDRDSILADTFEALLGALYLESGIDAVSNILDEVILTLLERPEEIIKLDFKTKLQEYVQADLRKSVVYEVVSMTGPSNKPEFIVHVKMDQIILGQGKGNSKKKAEQQAAQNAFEKLVK